jgi:hypothetical protein
MSRGDLGSSTFQLACKWAALKNLWQFGCSIKSTSPQARTSWSWLAQVMTGMIPTFRADFPTLSSKTVSPSVKLLSTKL